MATRTCRRDCGKTLFSVTLMFLLVVGAWFGWQWDFGWTERQVRATEEKEEKKKAKIHEKRNSDLESLDKDVEEVKIDRT